MDGCADLNWVPGGMFFDISLTNHLTFACFFWFVMLCPSPSLYQIALNMFQSQVHALNFKLTHIWQITCSWIRSNTTSITGDECPTKTQTHFSLNQPCISWAWFKNGCLFIKVDHETFQLLRPRQIGALGKQHLPRRPIKKVMVSFVSR